MHGKPDLAHLEISTPVDIIACYEYILLWYPVTKSE
jgi:hypothetical protein